MKKSINVPQQYSDLCSAISRQRKKIFLQCGCWSAAVLICEYLYLWNYFAEKIHAAASVLIAVFLIMLYPIKAGILTLLTDRGWEGTVKDVKTRSYIHFKRWGSGYRYTNMTTRFEGHLYLYGREGRSAFWEQRFPIRKKFILRGGGDELPYRSGDTVRRYRGTSFPVIVRRPGCEGYPPRICVFCGKAETDRDRQVCDFCGYSLITPDETVREIEYGM